MTDPRPTMSHVAPDGTARMVDVAAKPVTERMARAEGFVRISAELERQIRENTVKKGSVLEVARLAGMQSAKRTDELIPLCHPLPLDSVEVRASVEPGRVRIEATTRATARTGVEMEALTAVSVACLTVIDMGKAVDRAMVIEGVRLLEKTGGQRGDWRAPDARA
ncbi:MAG: cyclic pyranopterin monophosphate synthase MoaC [Planctomycetota bacterium]